MNYGQIITVAQLLKELDKYHHREFHVHHTWKPDHKDFTGSNHRALQDGMRNYHVKTNGWSDIAQHITVFPDGKIMVGRDFNRDTASILGYNRYAFMVENVGNFDKGHDQFTGEQRRVNVEIARWFHSKGKYIRFHNENAGKSCPGTGVNKDEFMKGVQDGGVGVSDFSDWQLEAADDAIDDLCDKRLLPWSDDRKEWKQAVRTGNMKGQPLSAHMQWLFFLMIHRAER